MNVDDATESGTLSHVWLTSAMRSDRVDFFRTSTLGTSWLPPVSANRRYRGPYTAAGSLVRAVAPAVMERDPALIDHHIVELLTVAPELASVLPAAPETLTALAVPAERTRYYAALRTLRIAHGLAEFVRAAVGLTNDDSRRWLFIDDLHEADYTDQEFVSVLLKRISPALLTIVAGSTPTFPARPTDSSEPLHPPAAGLPRTLAADCRHLAAPSARSKTSRHAADTDQTELARHFVEGDCVDDRPVVVAAYHFLADSARRELHDRRAAVLRATGAESWATGAIPYHLMRGGDSAEGGLRALYSAMDRCLRMGFYDSAIEAATAGLAAVDAEQRIDVWWRFTAKLPTMLSAVGKGADAEIVCENARAVTTAATHHQQLAYATAMLYTRHLEPERHNDLRAAGWINEAIAFSSAESDPKLRALGKVFNQNGLALIEAHRGRLERALALVSDGISELDDILDPSEHLLHRSVLLYNRAQVLAGMGRLDEALADFLNVIAVDPHYPEYHFDLANLLHRLGRDEDAMAEYDVAARLGPPFPEVHYNRADLLYSLGRLEDALTAFDYVLELDPGNSDARVNRAALSADLNDTEQAMTDIERGLSDDPRHPVLLALRGRLRCEAGELEGARRDLDAALEIDPQAPVAWALRGALNFGEGDLDAASRDLDKAVTLGGDASVVFNRGAVAQALGDYELADRHFSLALTELPDDPDLWFHRAECRHALGNLDGADKDARRVLHLDPGRRDQLGHLLTGPLVST